MIVRRYNDIPGSPPAVTEILKMVFPRPGLARWKETRAAELARKYPSEPAWGIVDRHPGPEAKRGQRVHRAIQAWLTDQEVGGMEDTARAMFHQWREWYRDSNIIRQGVEQVVADPPDYAGTLDLWGHIRDESVVVDWKTCADLPYRPYPDHTAQLWAYSEAYPWPWPYAKTGEATRPAHADLGLVVYISPVGVRAFPLESKDWTFTACNLWEYTLKLAKSLYPEVWE